MGLGGFMQLAETYYDASYVPIQIWMHIYQVLACRVFHLSLSLVLLLLSLSLFLPPSLSRFDFIEISPL
jgi:hypothetical protein